MVFCASIFSNKFLTEVQPTNIVMHHTHDFIINITIVARLWASRVSLRHWHKFHGSFSRWFAVGRGAMFAVARVTVGIQEWIL